MAKRRPKRQDQTRERQLPTFGELVARSNQNIAESRRLIEQLKKVTSEIKKIRKKSN